MEIKNKKDFVKVLFDLIEDDHGVSTYTILENCIHVSHCGIVR